MKRIGRERPLQLLPRTWNSSVTMVLVERMHQGRPLVAGLLVVLGVTVTVPRAPEQPPPPVLWNSAFSMVPSTLLPSFLVTGPVMSAVSHSTTVAPLEAFVMIVFPTLVAEIFSPTLTGVPFSVSSGLLVADAAAGTTARAMIAATKTRIFFAMFEILPFPDPSLWLGF